MLHGGAAGASDPGWQMVIAEKQQTSGSVYPGLVFRSATNLVGVWMTGL